MKSRLIQFRLHPGEEGEDVALTVYDDWISAGHPAREIGKNALIALGGYPIHVPASVAGIRQMLEDLQDRLVDTVVNMLEDKLGELDAMSPDERRQIVDETARSSFRNSLRHSITIADFDGEPE